MRAIRIHQNGGPDVLKLEEVDLPKPGKGEVRLRQHAVGVNFIDIYFRNGFYPAPGLPFTPGNEGAGEVVEVGPEVKDFKPGDRVAYVGAIGAYAQERNIEARSLFKLPRGISYETAAAMMLKGLTAQYLLRQTYRVKEGDTILVHAAAGGVGLILCQWGRALGATVIGTVGSPEKAKLAAKAGAQHTILYHQEDFAKRVEEITKGAKCAVVYDGVGKATFPGFARLPQALRHVRELRLGLGRDRCVRHRSSRRAKARCSPPARPFSRSSPTGRGPRRWRATFSGRSEAATSRSTSAGVCRSRKPPRRIARSRRARRRDRWSCCPDWRGHCCAMVSRD